MTEPFLITNREAGLVTVTLNRPERFNPLSLEMIAALQSELDSLASDPSVRVVVIAGAGRGFCAGHDLKEMRAHTGDTVWQRRLFDDCSRMMITLTRLPQPVIARVHGIATAAGCQLVARRPRVDAGPDDGAGERLDELRPPLAARPTGA